MVFTRRSGLRGIQGRTMPKLRGHHDISLAYSLEGGVWDVRQIEPLHSVGLTYEGTLMPSPLEGGPGG